MTFRPDDGDRVVFNPALHYPKPKKYNPLFHYKKPSMTPILPKDKVYKRKLECNSLYFNGIDSYINCKNNASFNITSTLTISTEIYLPVQPGDNKKIIGKQSSWLLDVQPFGSTYKIRFYNYGGASALLSSEVELLNKRYHVVITFDKDAGANNTKIYINGILNNQLTNANAIPVSVHDIYIGAYNGIDFFLKSFIFNSFIYNRIISPAEILQLSKRKNISPTGLVMNLPMTSDYSTKSIIKDESGNGNDGTLHDCKWNCDWIREKHKVI